MSSYLKRGKATGRGKSESYAAIPRQVMRSADFRALGPNAVRVLLWLAHNFKGRNNGDLAATLSLAKYWGIGGKDTLSNAIEQLIEAGMIVRTREGRFTNPGGRCALYALTWLPIDDCPGKDLDVRQTHGALRLAWPTDKKLGPDFFGVVLGSGATEKKEVIVK